MRIYHKLYSIAFRQDVFLKKDPLCLAILLECVNRAWWEETPNNQGLEQGCFFLSRSEYNLFGLKKNQCKQITTRLKKLEKAGYLELLTSGKTARMGNIYRLLPNNMIDPAWIGATNEAVIHKKNDTNEGTKKEREESVIKKGESLSPLSLSDVVYKKYISLFKKATSKSNIVRTGKNLEDIKYMDIIFTDKDMGVAIDILCKKLGKDSLSKEDQIKLLAKTIGFIVSEKDFWKKKLSSMKVICLNIGEIINEI